MGEKIIPNDVDALIQMAIARSEEENKNKELEEERKREDEEFWKERVKEDRKKCLEQARKNLSFLNALVRVEPLKSYLKLTVDSKSFRNQFPLWEEGGLFASLYLRSNGVYVYRGLNHPNHIFEKVSRSSLAKDALGFPSLSQYIFYLARWDKEKTIKCLRKQFTPIN